MNKFFPENEEILLLLKYNFFVYNDIKNNLCKNILKQLELEDYYDKRDYSNNQIHWHSVVNYIVEDLLFTGKVNFTLCDICLNIDINDYFHRLLIEYDSFDILRYSHPNFEIILQELDVIKSDIINIVVDCINYTFKSLLDKEKAKL